MSRWTRYNKGIFREPVHCQTNMKIITYVFKKSCALSAYKTRWVRVRLHLLTLFLALLSCPSLAQEMIKPVPSDDPQMNVAIAKAKLTFPEFLKLKSAGTDGLSQFTVKVLFVDGTNKEHMWVSPFRSASNKGFEGILKSSPRAMPSLRYDQQVTFTAEQVTDWGYTKNGKKIGYFTVCVFLARDANFRASVKSEGIQYECQH